jgi:translation initiation factor eIF-2B subunit delta
MNGSASLEEFLLEIREDNVSGATHLVRKGAQFLLNCLQEGKAEEIWALGRALIDAQPSMAPMVNLVNHLFDAIESFKDPQSIQEQGIAAVQGFLKGLSKGGERIRGHALPLLQWEKRVMTLSYSSTVLGVLEHAQAIEVICPEGRPLCEGLRTAKALGAKGIRTRLVVDSAAPSLMGECDVVVVGADAVTAEGVVNKIGTYALALAARERNVPFYVLAGQEKFLPFPLRIEERDPKEITQEAIPNGSVENRYFDCTPLDLITGVVTQEGVMGGKEIRRHLEGMKMSEGLKAR